MVLFNYSTRELTAKVVFYGPGLCGKTTNLQYIHGNLPSNIKGKMLSLATKTDRTLFFDFLPIDLGEIRGMKTRVQLYTVPGQVFYNETRKLVLKGVDGLVFVADSQKEMLSANVESFKNLEENLKTHGLKLAETPHVIQFNKRDLPNLAELEELNAAVNKYNAPFYESVATTGIGVQDTLKAITKLVLMNLTKKYDPKVAPTEVATEAPAPQPAVQTPSAGVPVAAAAAPVSSSAGMALSNDRSVPEAPPVFRAAPPASSSAEPTSTDFADEEIDELVDEVDDLAESPELATGESPGFEIDESSVDLEAPPTPVEPALVEEADSGRASFEFDRKVDPEWGEGGEVEERGPVPTSETIAAEAESLCAEEAPVPDPELTEGTAEVTLSQLASDLDLFDDPDLEVARMGSGQERQIVIPLEFVGGGEDQEARRFKLSVKLRLDFVD